MARRLRGPAAAALRALRRVYAPAARAEQLFMQMSNLSTMLSQLIFFMVCDRLLVTPGPAQRITCLYSLMYYNVVAYCVSYVKELIEKEDWSPYVNMARHSDVKHLAMTATKIVLEWTKAVTFIITVIFMLLVFGLEHGLEHYKPTTGYQILTGLYYACTEKVFIELWPAALAALRVERFEGMEPLYAPVFLKVITVALSLSLAPVLAWNGQVRLALLSVYMNGWVRGRHAWETCVRKLTSERGALARFRRAAAEELARLEDVCAVCLGGMSAARVMPCHHYFHADCLRRCLAASDKCPLCVRPFTFCS